MKTIKHTLIALAALVTTNLCAAQAPTAHNISMTPIVQASVILPFDAIAVNGNISSYTIETIPLASEGVLSLNMNEILMPVSEGMMITPDLASSLSFAPDTSFSGTVVFTYSATDENSLSSNIATYSIPVVSKQAAILPITLLSFEGNAENKKAQLYWQTTHENNSSYFELQRSTDGNSFETIATVTAKGGSSAINSYQHTDDLFFYNVKTVYYRIKMVDINGSYKYSYTVIIKLDSDVKNTIKAWPLPFTGNLYVNYYSEANETVKFSIHGVNGASVITGTCTVYKGSNTITINQAQSIPAGTYLLTVSNSTRAQTLKVMKQ